MSRFNNVKLDLPQMMEVRQAYDIPKQIDIIKTINTETKRFIIDKKLLKGASVAVCVGSRGIAGIQKVVVNIIKYLKSIGLNPYILCAMGSHGNASAAGQVDILKHRGITEENCGVPVKATMEVVCIGKSDCGIPLYFNKMAYEADYVVVINRVKAHTNFIGQTESGILKMMAIGLGNQQGAEHLHRLSLVRPQYEVISTAGRELIKRSNFLFGVALVENQDNQICSLRIAGRDDMEKTEAGLLSYAKSLMPKLPVNNIDLLIVDQIGKNISGQGIDPNVVGRDCCFYGAKRPEPQVSRIHVRDLTAESAGSAVGIGMADFALKRLIDKIDMEATVINCLTACAPELGKIPVVFNTDFEAITAALMSIRPYSIDDLGIVWIKDTHKLDRLFISHCYEKDIRNDKNVITADRNLKLSFSDGMLNDMF